MDGINAAGTYRQRARTQVGVPCVESVDAKKGGDSGVLEHPVIIT